MRRTLEEVAPAFRAMAHRIGVGVAATSDGEGQTLMTEGRGEVITGKAER